MPKPTPQTRWRVGKDRYNPWWYAHALMPDNTKMPATQKVWRSWSAAMGYANFQIAKANGRLPSNEITSAPQA
jgi:hypothetical protein